MFNRHAIKVNRLNAIIGNVRQKQKTVRVQNFKSNSDGPSGLRERQRRALQAALESFWRSFRIRAEAFDSENQIQYGATYPELTRALCQPATVLNQRLNGPLALGFQTIKVIGGTDIASRNIARHLDTREMSQ